MIKNIIFDMGKVLVGYDAMRVCEHYIENLHDRTRVCTALFVSPEWILLDMGVMPEEMAFAKICERLPKRLHAAARLCFDHWHEFCMDRIEEMEPLVRDLKEQGYGIYLCSNASVRLLECYRKVIPGIEYFDGILFSAAEKCIKPQREIYERLFAKFGLRPEECFFIDDLQLNIDGAKDCGMDGYCFEDGDIGKLKAVLAGLRGR